MRWRVTSTAPVIEGLPIVRLPDIRRRVLLPHPVPAVWTALTDPDALADWLMPNHFRAEIGHRFLLRTEPRPGFDGVVHAEVVELEPMSRMVAGGAARGARPAAAGRALARRGEVRLVGEDRAARSRGARARRARGDAAAPLAPRPGRRRRRGLTGDDEVAIEPFDAVPFSLARLRD